MLKDSKEPSKLGLGNTFHKISAKLSDFEKRFTRKNYTSYVARNDKT